jgi:hypothetical protein
MQFGRNLDAIWTQFGRTLDAIWTQFGAHPSEAKAARPAADKIEPTKKQKAN